VAATIVGVATGTPDGGVAIVRLSGARAETIAARVCGPLGPPRRLVRRALQLASGAEDALVVRMPAPASFTGEDVVELHVHGGGRNVRAVVEALLAAGASAAEPGEFTRRAFEYGRLSLDQAEGIAAVIAAQTDAGLEQARRLVRGELREQVTRLCGEIHALRCEVEANLDFPEDVSPGDVRRWQGELRGWLGVLEGWLGRFEAGRRARERARIVLAGPPNAGKSSIFNALLGWDRAIVSPVAGTTRDFVEAELRIGPLEATLVDTAGLRGTGDALEEQGISRSRAQISEAELVVWIEAADAEPAEPPAGAICVENKRDLGTRRPGWIGATGTAEGVEALREGLRQWHDRQSAAPWIGLVRHRDRARECRAALAEAEIQLAEEMLELVAFQLGVAERRLAEISGGSSLGPVGEDVLADIFSRFCIGK
jgi:tRNA modification GTPase